MESILIQGFYGERNLGDDYILYSIINSISKSKINKVTVITNGSDQYKELTEKFPDITIKTVQLSKLNLIKKLKLFSSHEYWIIGGGGLFPSESRKMAMQYLLRMLWARVNGVKVSMYGVEFNSFNDKLYSAIWKKAFSLCSNVIVRNRTNKKMISDLGYGKAVESSDVTFALDTDSELKDESSLLKNIKASGKEYIIWAISTPWLNREFENPEISENINRRYKKLCDLIASEINSYPEFTHVFLPFYDSMDLRIAHDLAKMVKVSFVCCDEKMNINIAEKRYLYKYARAAICMRFHSVLFALFHETPFCAISYSPKTSSVLLENEMEDRMVLYGVRSSQYFYKEFDVDEVEFRQLVRKTIENPIRNSQQSKLLKTQAREAEKVLLHWISG